VSSVRSAPRFEVVLDRDDVGAVAEAGIAEAERAVKAARDAFEKWRWTSFEERAQLLERAVQDRTG